MEQELPTLPEHLSSPLFYSEVRVTRSLVLCVCFVDCCLSFCTFSFGHCVVCSSTIYIFWLSLWYFQTFLKTNSTIYDTPTGTAETMLASFVYMIHRLVQQKQCWLHLSIWYTDWYSRNNAGFICLYDTPTGTAETMLASFVYMIHRLIQQKQCWLHLSIWYTDWYSRNNDGFICPLNRVMFFTILTRYFRWR